MSQSGLIHQTAAPNSSRVSPEHQLLHVGYVQRKWRLISLRDEVIEKLLL